MTADDTAGTGPAFRAVQVEVASGRRVEVSAQPSGCPDLVITPSVQITASGEAAFDGGGLILVQASTGRRVAAAQKPQALHDLARRLAWFDRKVIDPDYLADPANEGVLASVAELFRQWRAEAAQADIPARVCLARALVSTPDVAADR